jgi:dolichyl-phosphate-mannose--protein O-mannosyl transferase
LSGSWPFPIFEYDEESGLRTASTALCLGIVSLVLFFWNVNHPASLYYDEALYVSAAKAFLSGQPDPTPEVPPLGKLLIAGGVKAFGDNPWGWRAMSALFGAMVVSGIFLWTYLLLRDFVLAITAALLTLLNNFVFVMARVAMMDIFLVGFLVWGLVAFTAAIELERIGVWTRRSLLLASGVALGLACASKWNGVDTLAVVSLVGFSLYLFGKRSAEPRLEGYQANLEKIAFPALLATLVATPVVAYSLTYWLLSFGGNQSFDLHELVAKNVYIWRAHRAVPGNPAIASKWYSWMLQVSPQRALSYLVGNWFVMWGGLLAVIFCARRLGRSFSHTLLVLLYAANLLQWAFTPQKNLYYYYYFAPSTFLGVAIALALQDLPRKVWGIRLSILCVAAAAGVFLFCFPHMAHMEAPFDCALGCWP